MLTERQKSVLRPFVYLIYRIACVCIRKDDGATVGTDLEESSRIHYEEKGKGYHTDYLKSRDLDGPSRVLEVGSGNGRWLHGFSSLGIDAVGIEISDQQLEIARRNDPDNELQMVRGVGEQMPFRNEDFDLCFSYGVLMFTTANDTLREIDRVLADEGQFFISVQGEGYPFLRLYEAIQARDYQQFKNRLALVFRTIVARYRSDDASEFFSDDAHTAIPVSLLKQKARSLGWSIEEVEIHEYKSYERFLSKPVSYSIRGYV